MIYYTESAGDFTVHWAGVPEFFSAGANSFSIKLSRGSDFVDIAYGGLSAPSGDNDLSGATLVFDQ